MSNISCVFCGIIRGDISSHTIMRNDHIIVIEDIAPKAPVHYLIIPTIHIPDSTHLTKDTLVIAEYMFIAAQELATHLSGSKAFRLVCNNGEDAGQSVFHLHMHFLSGKQMLDLY